MIEMLRHFFGLCGEPHISIAWLFANNHYLSHYYFYMRFIINKIKTQVSFTNADNKTETETKGIEREKIYS